MDRGEVAGTVFARKQRQQLLVSLHHLWLDDKIEAVAKHPFPLQLRPLPLRLRLLSVPV